MFWVTNVDEPAPFPAWLLPFLSPLPPPLLRFLTDSNPSSSVSRQRPLLISTLGEFLLWAFANDIYIV